MRPGPSAPAKVPIAVDSPSTMANAEGGNSRCTISAGSVMMLPTEKPCAAQQTGSSVVAVVRVMTNRPAAWVNIETDEMSRGSSRSTTAPSVSRPIAANVVMMDTESAACARPTIGSMNAIWCTMKATCAINASANGPDTVQNGRLRRVSRRVQGGSAEGGGGGVVACEGTQSQTTGTKIATITS